MSRRHCVPEKVVREMHEAMTEQLGRPPRCGELASVLDLHENSVRHRLNKLGLPYTRMDPLESGWKGAAEKAKKQQAAKAEKKPPPPEAKKPAEHDPFLQHNYATFELRKRIRELKASGDPAQRPKKLPSPGEGYAPNERTMITCPICGRRKWIAPRMHPYWIRDAQGRVHHVCSAICTGDTTAAYVSDL